MIQRSATLFACFAALSSPIRAEVPQGAGIELRLLAFQPEMSTDEVFAHDPAATNKAAGVNTPLRSYLNHQFTTLMASSRRVVFTKLPDRSSLAQPDAVLGEWQVPVGLRSAILLFLPEKTGAGHPYKIMAIDDSKNAFPVGTFRVSNLSPHPVRILLEEKNYDFKPGQTGFITDPPVREGNQSGMKAYSFHDNNWQRIGSGIWPHPGESRVVQILFIHPARGHVQLRAFDDVPPRDMPPTEQ
jgi:hypothetical protein